MSVNMDEALQQAIPTHVRVLMHHVAHMHAVNVLQGGNLPPFELFEASDGHTYVVYVHGVLASNAN